MLSDIVIIFVLIIIKGFFNACSSSLTILGLRKAKYFSDKENKDYNKLLKIMDHSRKDINGASVLNSILSILIGFILAINIYKGVTLYFSDIVKGTYAFIFSSVSCIAVTSFFFALLGIVIPKILANKYPDKIALKFDGILHFFSVLCTPFIMLIDAAVTIFSIFVDVDKEDISEEEILMMVDASGEQGSIDEQEMEMINNIFDFDDKNVSEIATHRKDIVAVPIDITVDELVEVVANEKFSRIPVYEDDIDNIVGILHIKDFMNLIITKGKEAFNIKDLIMEPYFVPATKKTDALFDEMRTNKIHMAVVADEYGGTAGIVTMEDLIEEVMGEIQDEYDDEEEPEITEVTDNIIKIEGSASLEDVEKSLDIDLPVEEYDTLGGFIIAKLDRVPEDGERDICVEYENCIFRVDKVEDKRIVSVTVTKYEPCGEDN
ncbi:MAG: hemolysin family protein [Lachnospirales bacterium]